MCFIGAKNRIWQVTFHFGFSSENNSLHHHICGFETYNVLNSNAFQENYENLSSISNLCLGTLEITASSAFSTSSFEAGLATWNCFSFKLTRLVLSFSTLIIEWIDFDHSSQLVLFFSHSLQILAMPVHLFSICSVPALENYIEWATFRYAKFRSDIKRSTGLRFNSRNN